MSKNLPFLVRSRRIWITLYKQYISTRFLSNKLSTFVVLLGKCENMWAQFLTIHEVNSLESDRFIKIFGNIVEHCLAAGIGILKNRPFGSIDDVVMAIENYLDTLKCSEKEKILQLYPDSVSKLAGFSNSMLEFNTHQKIVNNTSTSLRFEEKKRLKQLSKSYREQHGFPFIFCSKEEDIHTICAQIESRLNNNKNEEIGISLKEVKKICKLRIHEIIK